MCDVKSLIEIFSSLTGQIMRCYFFEKKNAQEFNRTRNKSHGVIGHLLLQTMQVEIDIKVFF